MTKQKTDIREVLNEQVPEERDELYNDYVDEIRRNSAGLPICVRHFWWAV